MQWLVQTFYATETGKQEVFTRCTTREEAEETINKNMLDGNCYLVELWQSVYENADSEASDLENAYE